MRIFVNQTNLIQTTPVLDRTSTPVTDATITAKILESNGTTVVTGSEVTLVHVSGGIYNKTMPLLATLANDGDYFLEVTVEVEGTQVWYLKQPVKAVIRSSQPNEQ